MCVYTFVCAYTHLCVYIFICVYVCVYMFVSARTRLCVCVFVSTYVCVCVVRGHTCVCECVHSRAVLLSLLRSHGVRFPDVQVRQRGPYT